MSLNMRYIVLTVILLVILLALVIAPQFTGRIITPPYNEVKECKDATEYYGCIKCCEDSATLSYGKAYYGTEEWNAMYNSCWNMYCEKFSDKDILTK